MRAPVESAPGGKQARGSGSAATCGKRVCNLMSNHVQNSLDPAKLNRDAVLPYSLRLMDFEIAIGRARSLKID